MLRRVLGESLRLALAALILGVFVAQALTRLISFYAVRRDTDRPGGPRASIQRR